MPSSIQSALHPAGIQAARIAGLWWVMFWVSTAVFVLVLVAVALAVRRGRTEGDRPSQRALETGVGAALAVTIVTLVFLLFDSVITGRAVASLHDDHPLSIQIVGNQWWWDVVYQDPVPSQQFTTANEIHLPVGKPVALTLKATDVIHSFWAPNLHGKMDLIPGRSNTAWLRADRVGVFRGQCAEYCGLQHANMALTITVETPDAFERWRHAQLQPAPEPSTPEQVAGREVVERGPCALCHTVRGTTAGAVTGPDLTHVASRSTLAAGRLPNTPEQMEQWINDPQHFKPGNKMPAVPLDASQLRAVVAYMETLR
jgi:cytochrome c oxidase subunit 2